MSGGGEHLSRPVLPKQCVQLKETWVYLINWCFPKMKFSGRVKPNIVSGLPVTQLHDAILHSPFLPFYLRRMKLSLTRFYHSLYIRIDVDSRSISAEKFNSDWENATGILANTLHIYKTFSQALIANILILSNGIVHFE